MLSSIRTPLPLFFAALFACAGSVGCSGGSGDGGGAGSSGTSGFGAFGGFGATGSGGSSSGGFGAGGLVTGGAAGSSGGSAGFGNASGSGGVGATGSGGASGSGASGGASGSGASGGSTATGGTSGASGSGGTSGAGGTGATAGTGGTVGSGGSGGTNPAITELSDPNRPSLSYECTGSPLTAAEIVKLFSPGTGWLPLGLDSAMTTVQVSRSCAPLTGCSAWTSKSTSSKVLAHAYYFSAKTAASLMATKYDSYWGKFNGDDVVPVSGGDIFLVNDQYERPMRARLTRLANGDVCVSAATTVNTFGSKEDFIVGKGVVAPAPAGSALGAKPSLPQSGKCTPGEPSTQKLASSWFPPGTSNLNLNGEPSFCDSSYRYCHPVTGCSVWTNTSCASSPKVTGLRVASSGTELEAHLVQSSTHRYPTISGGAYSQAFNGWNVSGSINLSCISWAGAMSKDQSYPGSGFTYERGTTHFENAGRIDRP